MAEQGCELIDCDDLAREITEPGSPVLGQLAEVFGAEIIGEDGALKRGELAARAFGSEANRQKLNSITHGAIISTALERINGSEANTVVIDAAVLLETELAQHCDLIIVVNAPQALRLQRIIQRDGISEDDARRRIEAQAHMNFMGHTTIDTTQGEVELRHAIEAILAQSHPLGGGGISGSSAHPGGVIST